jgi:hypothetical protein
LLNKVIITASYIHGFGQKITQRMKNLPKLVSNIVEEIIKCLQSTSDCELACPFCALPPLAVDWKVKHMSEF